MDVRVVDVFAGCGGFTLGFGRAVKAAIENHPHAVKTYIYNFPWVHVFPEDAKRVSGRVILETVGEVDVVIGGPPCEPFTSMNQKRKGDPLDRLLADAQGRLVLEFIRLVDELRPRIYVMENVPDLVQEPLRDVLRKFFKRIGYEAYFNFFEAHRYGVPSRRYRVFISNIKFDLGRMEEAKCVEEALKGLPPLGEAPNHNPIKVGVIRLRKIRKLKWGEALFKFRDSLNRVHTNWVRLHPRKIAPTIHGKSRFIHPYEDRLLTVREQARLMSFPDDHVLYGGINNQFNQVGEAVPPLLAEKIARFIFRKLTEL
ncbi:MAG: DNA cytosine methyltransferase [Nitrososphaeria archaeon]|nr:DNA cytosine methyltransferase [Aigarchaeota archaeon]MCX8187187.1 DNA cytosine methyltransferase [Nitrososphaeria archaeon]MDW8021783.1 DNA cytosine methyltransferase [Nitrososphaerota archaeon]